MNILIAPDSFKGSATAQEVAKAMKKGIIASSLKANIDIIPMGDGGEGTAKSLIDALGGDYYEVVVKDPLGRPIIGEYGIINNNNTAVIELSSASGLDKLSNKELNPYLTSTYGTGQLIIDALNKGVRKFIICLGGSATNDAGMGLLKALGFKFFDKNKKELDHGGRELLKLDSINDTHVHSAIYDSAFQVACDVNNPLIGNNGASAVFGPQKGANKEMVKVLDNGLKRFGEVVQNFKGVNINEIAGSGAAGGTAGGLLAFLNAELKSGIKIVMESVNLEKTLKNKNIDLLLTGEGQIDGQTASGKVVFGVANKAKMYNIPTIAIVGTIGNDVDILYKYGLTSVFSIINKPMSLEKAIINSLKLIELQTEQIFRLLYHYLK